MKSFKFSEYFKNQSKTKFFFWVLLMILSPILITITLIYTLSMPRTLWLMKWTNYVLYFAILISIIAYLPPLLALFDVFIAKARKRTVKIPSRAFWAISVIFTIVGTFSSGYILITPEINTGDKDPQLLVVGDNSGTYGIPNLAITFYTEQSTINTLKIGLSENSLSTSLTESAAIKQHVFLLNNLIPNTTYFYQINNVGKIYNFTTMTNQTDVFHFAYCSDPHFGASTNNITVTKDILTQIADPAHNFNMFFCGGDFVDMGFKDADWKLGLDTISPVTTHIPFRPMIGNHDGFLGGQNKYMAYFYPQGMPSSSGSRLYYELSFNHIHIFVMDLEWGIESYSAAEQAWFESAIATVPKGDWTIVMDHCFYYASGVMSGGMPWWDQQDMIDTFNATFVKYGVDMVFSGHNHDLEVLNDSGVVYNVVGGMGGILDPPRTHDGAGSLCFKSGQFGFADVSINGSIATITYRDPEYGVLYSVNVTK